MATRLALLPDASDADARDRQSQQRRPHEGAAFDVTSLHLARALDAECVLIEDLHQALLRQRAGLAADDTASIEGSAKVISRLLVALGDSRHRCTQLVMTLTGGPAVSLFQLESALGRALPPTLATARATIRAAAEAVSRDVAINQHVLRKALEAGDAFLQRLFASAANPMPVYSPTPPTAPHGVLINQRA